MMQGKSKLNANAAPYIPVSKGSSGGNNKIADNMTGVSKSEDDGVGAINQLQDNVNQEQSLGKFQLYANSSLENDSEKQRLKDETSMLVDILIMMFPGYSAKSLTEFLEFNNGNLDEAIDFLQGFEDEQDVISDKPSSSS